jgi:hypothetical protein
MRKVIHLAWFTTMQDRTGVLDDGEMDALDDALRLYHGLFSSTHAVLVTVFTGGAFGLLPN